MQFIEKCLYMSKFSWENLYKLHNKFIHTVLIVYSDIYKIRYKIILKAKQVVRKFYIENGWMQVVNISVLIKKIRFNHLSAVRVAYEQKEPKNLKFSTLDSPGIGCGVGSFCNSKGFYENFIYFHLMF